MEQQTLKEKFTDLLSDGYTLTEATPLITAIYPGTEIEIERMYRDPDILKEIIEQANAKLGQTWGTMWKSIRQKAALGDVRHARLLIEHVREMKGGVPKSLRFIFDSTGEPE